MSGAEIPPAAALYSDVVDTVKQRGKWSRGLVHSLQTGREPLSFLIFPQRMQWSLQKADGDNTDNNQNDSNNHKKQRRLRET